MTSMVRFEILYTDGRRVSVLTNGDYMSEVKRMIGAVETGVDFVNLRDGRLMVVNDRGWETRTETWDNRIRIIPIRPLLPINSEATKLYHAVCIPGTTHQIAGDVALIPDVSSQIPLW